MHYPHIMIDIETLGTGDGAAIIQFGAVRFDLLGDGSMSPDTFSYNVAWDSDNFGTIEPGTLQWWLDQDPTVRKRVFAQGGAISLTATLRCLSTWLGKFGTYRTVWACPPSFDLRLIRQAYERCDYAYTVPFWKERDFRTMRELVGTQDDVPMRTGNQHNALSDAMFQAQYLINISRRRRNKEKVSASEGSAR